jgi:thiopeptide-type bacteriocin biosynthesis protein
MSRQLDPPSGASARTGTVAAAGTVGLYAPLDWALARAPLLPVDAYPPAGDADADADACRSDDAWVHAAVAVGSPDLSAALWGKGDRGSASTSARRALSRYRIRMTTRPTPYGLFAGVGLATWGAGTDLRIGPDEPRTRTRPDMQWLSALVARLEGESTVRRELALVAHPGLLVRAGRVFMTQLPPDATGPARHPFSIRATDVVRATLQLARRPIAHEALVEALVARSGATPDRVRTLIGELCARELLLSDLRPPLTGAGPADHVRDRLMALPAAAEAAHGLAELLAELERFDALPIAARPGALPGITRRIEAVHPIAPTSGGLQVDLALSLAGHSVHGAVGAEAARAAELLLRLTPWPAGPPYLDAYRRAFTDRYGSDRSVALLELLDPQFGLGAPEEHAVATAPTGDRPALPRRDQVVRDLALSALRDRRQVLELDDALLAALQTWSPSDGEPPASLDLSAFVAASSAAELDAGRFLLVVGPGVGADGAGSSAGRFAHLLGPEAIAALARTARPESDRNRRLIRAEVVSAPGDARSANVMIRPAIHRHEIAAGALPGVPWDDVIGLDELTVSVRGGRFRIDWPAGGAELNPVQGHMLSSRLAAPVVRFLLAVGIDRAPALSPFYWGPAETFPFLPRIQRGRIVLSLARWRLRRDDGEHGLSPDPADRFPAALARWRADWEVPRWAYLTSADNRLLLDLEDGLGIELLRDELRRPAAGDGLVLQEALPGPEDAWLVGPSGRHLLELSIPVVRRPRRAARVAPPERRSAPVGAADGAASAAARLRAPGSDWLYLKLYGPTVLQDDLLAGPVRSIAHGALSTGIADRWFFLRYADPDPHLRIRFHGDPGGLQSVLFGQLCAWAGGLITDGTCRRLSFDTYERELERYGAQRGMTLAEAIFSADSTAVAALLAPGPGVSAPAQATDRLALAVLTIDDLLDALGWDPASRLDWYRAHAPLSADDGREFRARRAELQRLLDDRPAGPAAGRPPALDAILAQRRRALAPLGAELTAVARQSGHGRARLCASYVHLHCNRLLGPGSELETLALALARRAGEARAHR